MKRIYTILSCLLLGVMALVGLTAGLDEDATYSPSERRKLKTAPDITLLALLDGSYFDDFTAYFADTFPGREKLKQTNSMLNGFYYFGGLGEDTALILDFSTNGASQGEALQPETVPTPEETHPLDTEMEETEPDVPEQTEPSAQAEQLGAVLLVGDSAFDVAYAHQERLVAYAQAVNAIADTLGEEISTMVMPVPNSAEFYTHEDYHTGATSQAEMFRVCRENLAENVTYVDAYTALARHTEEYLYFRTDHHWTQLGAYYAYTALCEVSGLTSTSLDQFETGCWYPFVGTMYTYAADYPQAQVLKNNPDTVHYWKPCVDYSCYFYSDTTLSDPYPTRVICGVGDSVDNKYLTFMGGDHPVTVVETEAEGPCILVIKESYGNALIPWLTSHYSRIVVLDPREYFAVNDEIDLAAFAAEQGVDQCLIVNYPMMLNSEGYIAHLENLTK